MIDLLVIVSFYLINTCIVPLNLKTYVNLNNIHVNNVLVYFVLSTQFLGVHIDYNPLWKTHTNIL